MKDKRDSAFNLAFAGLFLLVCAMAIVIAFHCTQEIKILNQEITILTDNYLSNIQNYRQPLWLDNKDKTEFLAWVRESAERQIK